MSYTEGRFLAEVVGRGLSRAKTGTEQVVIEFRLLEGPDTGSRITYYGAITEARLKYTVADLRTLGWTGDDLDDLSSIANGTQAELVLVIEEYQGKERAKVRFINKAGGAPTLDAEAAKKIGQSWRDRIRALTGADAEKAPF